MKLYIDKTKINKTAHEIPQVWLNLPLQWHS